MSGDRTLKLVTRAQLGVTWAVPNRQASTAPRDL
jgi:hypothetical protein